MLGTFDAGDPSLIVGRRDTTIVPTQTLFLINNPFVLKQAEEFAKRVLKSEGGIILLMAPDRRLRMKWQISAFESLELCNK